MMVILQQAFSNQIYHTSQQVLQQEKYTLFTPMKVCQIRPFARRSKCSLSQVVDKQQSVVMIFCSCRPTVHHFAQAGIPGPGSQISKDSLRLVMENKASINACKQKCCSLISARTSPLPSYTTHTFPTSTCISKISNYSTKILQFCIV